MRTHLCRNCQRIETVQHEIVQTTVEKTVTILIDKTTEENPHIIYRHDEREIGLVKDETQKYVITRPDLWPIGKEVEFLMGLYGIRVSGELTVPRNEWSFVTIKESEVPLCIVNIGGVWSPSGEDGELLQSIYTNNMMASACIFYNRKATPPRLVFSTNSIEARVNNLYDVWVTYRKHDLCPMKDTYVEAEKKV